MAIPKNMRLKGHRTFHYIHNNSINIYPYSPIPSNKDSYAVVLKVINPTKSGLYQFHSYGQPKGESVSSYLGSWTIVIN